MKSNLIAFTMLGLLAATSTLSAQSASSLDTFESSLKSAVQARDLEALKALYDFDGVPQVTIDQAVYRWQTFFDENTPWTSETVTYVTLDEAQSNPIDQKPTGAYFHPINMNGTMYGPNLTVVGFVNVIFTQGSTRRTETFRLPVGQDIDGSYKITMIKPLK